MNRKGFTVLEMMVALGLAIVMISLVVRTVITTNQGLRRVEKISDNAVQAVAFVGDFERLLKQIPAGTSFQFEHHTLRFSSRFQGMDADIFTGKNHSGMVVIEVNNVVRTQYQGDVQFIFLYDNEWRDEWRESELPDSVACVLIPAGKKDNPWEYAVNLSQSLRFNLPELQVEEETEMEDGQI